MPTARIAGAIAAAILLIAPAFAHADGRVDRVRIDPHGRVSGLILTDGTEYVVHGPKATWISDNVQPGDMIHVDTGPSNTLTLLDARTQRFLDLGGVDTIARGGGPTAMQSIAVQYPRIDNAAALDRLVLRGRVRLVMHNPNGDPTGFLLDNGAQVHLVPGIEGVFNDIHVGDELHVDGRGTRTPLGDSVWAMEISRTGNGLVLLDMTRGIGAPELGIGK